MIGLLMGFLPRASAQQQPGRIEFEVASVKPANPNLSSGGAAHSSRVTTGQLETLNLSLKNLVMSAYQVNENQVVGGPAWLNSAGWDIIAKFPAGATRAQLPQMIRSLLADRFHLAIHRETRTLPVYALKVAKSGPILHESTAIDGAMSAGPRMIRYSGVSMADFANQLSSYLERQVIDQTGLNGRYEVKLAFAPVQPGVADDAADSGASIFAALQEQLGLRLESAKGPVEVVVIDGAEKPSAN